MNLTLHRQANAWTGLTHAMHNLFLPAPPTVQEHPMRMSAISTHGWSKHEGRNAQPIVHIHEITLTGL